MTIMGMMRKMVWSPAILNFFSVMRKSVYMLTMMMPASAVGGWMRNMYQRNAMVKKVSCML